MAFLHGAWKNWRVVRVLFQKNAIIRIFKFCHGTINHRDAHLPPTDSFLSLLTHTIVSPRFDLPMADSRFKVGATVWAKGSVVTNESELHRRYGSNAGKTHLPGIVLEGYIKPSSKGRQMKYVKATFYYGGTATKIADISISSSRSSPPDSANIPTDLAEFIKAGGRAETNAVALKQTVKMKD